MIGLLISILIALIVFSLVWWILTMLPLPAPLAQIVRVIFVVLVAIWLIYELLGFTGTGHPLLR